MKIRITEGTMVLFKALLYFTIPFLTPIVALLTTSADANTMDWPSLLKLTAATGTGLISGLVALRAYFDGSQNRWEDRKNGTFRIPPAHGDPAMERANAAKEASGQP